MNCLRVLCFVLNGVIPTFAAESPNENGFFMNNVEYKNTLLVLSVLNFGLQILTIITFVLLWKYWKIGKCLKEHNKLMVKRNLKKREKVVSERKEKPGEELNVDELSKKQIIDDSLQYLQCKEDQPVRFAYEEISEVRVPKLPSKKKRVKKPLTKTGSKTQTATKRRPLGEAESLNLKEYSKLTEQPVGPYVYDEIKIDPTCGSLPRIVTSSTLSKEQF